MLISIDILLGLSEIMLLASMAVTVLAHFVNSALNSRGQHLLYGLADLLQQVDPELKQQVARRIASTLLKHPLICGGMGRVGGTIHREEFTKLLMDLASGNAPEKIIARLGEEAQQALKNVLAKNDIDNPGEVLNKARMLALELEINQPELATNVRHSMALLQAAKGQWVAKINTWFDQTIDRVGDRFTLSARVISVTCALVVACAMQLDTIQLINRLSIDTELRNSLVQKAVEMGQGMTDAPEAFNQLTGQNKNDIKQLLQLGIVNVPKSYAEWKGNWANVSPLGIAFSVMLLSLGAPFWYNALKSLLKLRSALADKDDAERKARQTAQQPARSPAENLLLGQQTEAEK